MKHISGIACLLLVSIASTSALAARDTDQLIQQDKANKAAIAKRSQPTDGKQATSEPLPLDHGPRAVTTPWLNKQRLAKSQAAAAEEKPAK